MKRITTNATDGGCVAAPGSVQACEGGWRGPAIDRLAAFEELVDTLDRRVREIPEELAALRAQGREKTVRARELTGEKMMAQMLLEMVGNGSF